MQKLTNINIEFSGPLWPPIMSNIATIIESSLNMRPLFDHAESGDIVEHVESTFIALEPFLQPTKDGRHVNWPDSEQTQLFFDLLLRRYHLLAKVDPGTGRLKHFIYCLFRQQYNHCCCQKCSQFFTFS